MIKTTPAIAMQMSTTVPVYKPYNERNAPHHAHNRILTPLSHPQVKHLSNLFNDADGGDVDASIHDNGLLNLQTGRSSNVRRLMKDMHYAQDVLRLVADDENYLVGSYANVPNSKPKTFKPYKNSSPVLHYLHQQGPDGHDAIDKLAMQARASFTFSTPDLAIADKLLKVATVISPMLQLMFANQSNFQRGVERDYNDSIDLPLSYNHAYDNSGKPLQRGGLLTDVIASDQPFAMFVQYEDDLKESHGLHPDSKLNELAKDKKPGKPAYEAKASPIHLFMPDVEAHHNRYHETYDVTLHIDYNTQPASTLAFLHSLLGTPNNLNGTASLLANMGLPIDNDQSRQTADIIAGIRADLFEEDHSALINALFSNNNRDTCASNAIKNNMHIHNHVLDAFCDKPFDTLDDLYKAEKAANQMALQRTQKTFVLGGF